MIRCSQLLLPGRPCLQAWPLLCAHGGATCRQPGRHQCCASACPLPPAACLCGCLPTRMACLRVPQRQPFLARKPSSGHLHLIGSAPTHFSLCPCPCLPAGQVIRETQDSLEPFRKVQPAVLF